MSLTAELFSWLQPLYARLRSDLTYARLSPSHQFEALLRAAREENQASVAAMIDWTPAQREAVLGFLATANDRPSVPPNIELWRVRKAERELSCVAVNFPHGVDLRLMEGAEFLRTSLFQDEPTLVVQAAKWLGELHEEGWRQIDEISPEQFVVTYLKTRPPRRRRRNQSVS
jgi:hypothetical protein